MTRSLLPLLLLLASAPLLQAQGPELRVMTFNIRYAHTTAPNLWPDRRAVVAEVIRDSGADIVGTQEGLYPQLVDMEADLPGFGWIGLGREGGSRGEFMGVFYRKDRLVPLEFDHFWLSDTPEAVGSRSWGNRIPRMVTWVRFREQRSGRQFYLVNTHFDHESQPSREQSAALVLSRLEKLDPALPVIVTGDFNAGPRNPVHARLTAGGVLRDSWSVTERGEPPIGTFHGFQGVEAARGKERIDWILTRGAVEPVDTEILTHQRNGQYPSDHFPVLARIRFR